ncbi:unnamed protein product [Mytilus edulis]|uniref:Uncharacterized protein n=1 Tax=Mytilus edulis TaxID=6550 RepID=A0A8S3RK65_MYTED|nr:unnamed protein product [Mytilus edulis]
MPSKYNEKIMRVDRLNKMEKTRLDFIIRRYDKEKISLVQDIDREKRAVVKDFAHVKRTSGFSEEGIPPSNEKDEDFKNDPLLKFGPKRINSAKSIRSFSARSRTALDYYRNQSQSSESDDEVFITEEINTLPLPDLSNIEDIERYEKELVESYKNVFKNTVVTVKKSDRKNLKRFLSSITNTNGHSLHSVTEEENGPTSPSVKKLIEQILEEEDTENNNTLSASKHISNIQITPRSDHNSVKLKPENGILKTRKLSASTNQTSDIETDSMGRLIRQTSSVGSRQRKVSINSLASGFDSSVISNMWGSIGDISVDSNGQRKPSNWRKYVAAEQAPIPETQRLVTLTTVVKAALAFSKTARRRALDKLVEEQSVDTRQIIKEERIRRLQSRNNVLMSLSTQFSVDESSGPFTLIQEENHNLL